MPSDIPSERPPLRDVDVLELAPGHRLLPVAQSVAEAGGRARIVGGWVRDRLLGLAGGDLDVEVAGLSAADLESLLAGFGEVVEIGRAFPVLRIKGLDVDFCLPRGDSQSGAALEAAEPGLDFAEAVRRRDLRINAIGWDPIRRELLDPLDGRSDLSRGRLRACDPERFGDDPLRGLRVAHFLARFEFEPDRELEALCADLDLSEIPGERYYEELRKLLMLAARPSLGLAWLRECGLLRFLPELASLVGVPQDPEWHPEGPVWEHTLRVVDEAARLRTGVEREDALLLWGALCHDLGKPETTVVGKDARVRSPQHDRRGALRSEEFLGRLRAPHALVEGVSALVRHHLAPSLLVKQGSGPAAYRRLARRLEAAGIDFELLVRVARADHWGRTTEEALQRIFPAGERCLEIARSLQVEHRAAPPVIRGRDLLAKGFTPGPEIGRILECCGSVQDETGWREPEAILKRALAELGYTDR